MKNEEQNIDNQEGNGVLPCISGSAFDDNYLADNIVEARTNHDKACEVYRNYVGKAETQEERLRRINAFRCGGW
jgi:hypothetical protein